jgi:hypothetical protein
MDTVEETKWNPWYYKIGNELIKKRKPCVPGNQVHISDMDGCFTVHHVTLNYFVVCKNREARNINWDRFICLKGEGKSLETQVKRGLKNAIDTIRISSMKNALMMELLKEKLLELKK